MRTKLFIILINLVMSLVYSTNLEKKKQLMSPSEIIDSIDTNLMHFKKFVTIISKKKNEKAIKKCIIALKNLNTLVAATEKSNISVNLLTLITINGIIWHPEPCNNPMIMLKHIEMYYDIKSSEFFNNFTSNSRDRNDKKYDSSYSNLTKSIFKNKKFNFKKNSPLKVIDKKQNEKQTDLKTELSNDLKNLTRITDILIQSVQEANVTNIPLNLTEKYIGATNTTSKKKPTNNFEYILHCNESYVDIQKKEREKEIKELLNRRGVSSKAETGFKDSLNKLLSKKMNTN